MDHYKLLEVDHIAREALKKEKKQGKKQYIYSIIFHYSKRFKYSLENELMIIFYITIDVVNL